jgi:acetolactate synthase-1/2/3 large subunit
MKTTDLLVKCLENVGVKYVFGIVGKETIDFVHSLTDSSIEFIVVRHEQSAAFMANIYGQLTNEVGVCTATLGPGATNLVTGIGSAFLDYAPVVAICGQTALNRQHKISHQYINLVELFQPITKWSIQVKDGNTIPEIIRKAFNIAQYEKPGPVYIELPENIAKDNTNRIPISKTEEGNVKANEMSINAAKSIIHQSEMPFILVGKGVVRHNAEKELQQFVDMLKIPVAHTFMANGVLPPEHPLNFYTFGFSEKDYVVNVLREADLIITIGLDMIENLPKDWNLDKKPVLHIDATPSEVDEYYPIKFELIGNIKENLSLLIKDTYSKKAWTNLTEKQQRIKDGHGLNEIIEKQSELLLSNVIQSIHKGIDLNTIILSDVGAHKMEIARIIQPMRSNQLFISNGFASMGIALPGAIAAKLACPKQPVICVTGDGGFLMSLSELETAKRLKTAIIILVLSDGMYGLEKKMMVEQQSSDEGVYFSNPDFVKLSESFGIKSYRVENPVMLQEKIEENLYSDEITLIEIPIHY